MMLTLFIYILCFKHTIRCKEQDGYIYIYIYIYICSIQLGSTLVERFSSSQPLPCDGIYICIYIYMFVVIYV